MYATALCVTQKKEHKILSINLSFKQSFLSNVQQKLYNKNSIIWTKRFNYNFKLVIKKKSILDKSINRLLIQL